MLRREKIFLTLPTRFFKQLGFELAIVCVNRNKNTEYHTYQKYLTEHCVEIKYTIENNDGDLDDIKRCTIEMTFEPSSGNKDKNEEVANKKIFIITGFKIVDAINNQLIIEPIGDEQKIVIEDKNTTTNDLQELNKSKKYLLPLDNKQLENAISINNPFTEYKSLLGLGCVTGDEQSCCGCLFW